MNPERLINPYDMPSLDEAIADLKRRIRDYAKEHGLNPNTILSELDEGRQETWEHCVLLQDMKLLEGLKKAKGK